MLFDQLKQKSAEQILSESKNPTKKERKKNQWNDDYVASLLDKVKYIWEKQKKIKNKKQKTKRLGEK